MIKITYCKDGTNNWGDYIAPVLVKYLSGEETSFVKSEGFTDEDDVFAVVGSILSWQQKPNLQVWGPGFMCDGQSMLVKPKKVYAVRGPLTRELLLKQGVECPEVYGDPALLLPKFYFPKVEKKYKLGIIPHYVDKDHNWLKKIDSNVKIIDICNETYKFIDELLECEMILSSSLHGVIAADAYGIPNMWIKMSDKVGGNGFKFKDYFMSVGREYKCYLINDDSNLQDVVSEIPEYKFEIDLDLLISSCPFKK